MFKRSAGLVETLQRACNQITGSYEGDQAEGHGGGSWSKGLGLSPSLGNARFR